MNQSMLDKISEAQEILKELGLPVAQQNERAALTLLALANVSPTAKWATCTSELHRTVDLMEFMKNSYQKDYQPNSRETIRRQTLHQFMQHSLVTKNRDDLSRATNSGLTNYSLNKEIIAILKKYPKPEWKTKASNFAKNSATLFKKHKKRVAKTQIPITLPNSAQVLKLSAGAHNQLHADIIHVFLPQFASEDIKILYIGDTASIDGTGGKHLHLDKKLFKELNIPELAHDKLPDVVAYDPQTKWLYLIEAVTSHGPISEKRWQELESMLQGCTVDPVYVTAFPDRATFRKYSADIAWETEVWLSENPEHMIHFNGDRFLGPH